MSRTLYLADPEATGDIARRLAASCPARAIVYLEGPLGAGKSTLARAWLRALGVTGPIKSPTYTLVERYRLPAGEAAHLDLYRLAAATELDFLGLDDLAQEAGLWLVEWPERGRGGLPGPDLRLQLDVPASGRQLLIDAASPVGEAWLARMAP